LPDVFTVQPVTGRPSGQTRLHLFTMYNQQMHHVFNT